MAYNPFDDVIDQDPAYMQKGGELQRSVLPQRRVNYDQKTFKPVATAIAKGYQLLTPEQETLKQIEKNQQLRALATAQAFTGTEFENFAGQFDLPSYILQDPKALNLLNQAGFKRESFTEGMSRTGQYLYGDQRQAYDKLASGQQLTKQDRIAIALSPLDSLDFLFPPIALKKLANIGFKTVDDVLKSTSELEEVKQIKNYFGGQGFRPDNVVMEPADMGRGSGGLSLKKGPNRATLDARTKIDNYLNTLDSKQTTTAPEIAKETGVPYTQVDSLMRSSNYKNNPKIVKAQPGDAPLFFKNYKIKNDPQGELPGVPTYLRDMSLAFNKKFGREPTAPELQLFIKQTETNPEIVEYFSKSPLSRMQGFKSNKDQLGVAAAQSAPIKNVVKQELEKNTPEAITFKSALDVAEQDLKRDLTKANAFSFTFDRNQKVFEPIFGSGKSGKSNFTRYMKQERGVEPRMDRLDAPGSPIPQQSAKKIKRAEQQLTFMLESKKVGKNKKYDTDIARDTSMFRFLSQKYRGMINDKGGILNPEDFMDNYVMPFKGNTKEETIANLAQEYNKKIGADDIEEFNEFLKVDNKYLRLRDLTESLMDELKLSGKYTDEQLEQINLSIRPNFGHAYPIKKTNAKGRFEGLSSDARFLRAQPAVYNVSYQNTLDGTMQKIIDNVNKSKNIEELRVQKPKIITPEKNLEKVGVSINIKDFENQLDYLNALTQKVNQAMVDKGLFSILAQSKKSKNVLDVMKTNYDDKSAAYFFGGPEKSPDEYMKMIRENLLEMGPDLKYVKENITGRVGGKRAKPMVRMAIGGDPLQNINQQQFSPDPAVDQDFFREAVESGNLQAGLYNLFKVFTKPKSVATPSNVKKVEEARSPLPQGVPGQQQIAPLQEGKQDFYFKSFFLDQLNDPNAPKAELPEGWLNYLIKGKKVPQAELLDTGIIQYLQDTAQFFPNKKITRSDLEDLYDMSPLGNLEVRVKQTVSPNQQGFGEGQFYKDQGQPRHKNAGRANIDTAADDYFEVVINAPNLPGQKKAFIRSSHYEEPNTIGFTRVGTYKNANDETVAVIQEMQTDMLTEVRKEQERLLALVSNLRKQRAKLVREIEGDPDYSYYKNELKIFDQKYPPNFLDSLENEKLIKPFPNIVAKELIPEKTASLNSIQKQINELAMANVEQYTDPAYKTKVFDLAQDQQLILDQLMSMNRATDYDAKMTGIKVPSTSDINDLRAIADEEYLPSYALKDLETFPPIPFNKQPDYVDLLIKATIKAAQEKGINKVAIMPADIGANTRWGKETDDAKKKFRNLYDKVGVQQLKNIAKKYDGVVEEENIIDSTKPPKALKFLNRNVDGELDLLKEEVPSGASEGVSISLDDANYYLNEQLYKFMKRSDDTYGPKEIVLTREIAPGQYQDFFVNLVDDQVEFVPLGAQDSINDALIVVEEFNPQVVKMFTITLDPSKMQEPMYMFKKKDGGHIAKDSLVSITDIYGEYGR